MDAMYLVNEAEFFCQSHLIKNDDIGSYKIYSKLTSDLYEKIYLNLI